METKKFKPFDKVIIKSRIDEFWSCDLYSHLDKDTGMHETINRAGLKDNDILPYEGNEHLVGTTDSPDEEVRLEEGEWVAFVRGSESHRTWAVGKFCELENHPFSGEEQHFRMYPIGEQTGCYIQSSQIVKFSDFNPNDMEETKKHILCVKNGKIVKYKGS